jgi:hypothetical protein
VLLQLRLVLLVKPQAAQDRNGRDDEFPHREPDVSEVRAVGLFAVAADSKRNDGCDPDDEGGGDELEDAVPVALERMLVEI